MKKNSDFFSERLIVKPKLGESLRIPFYADLVMAGFPSPAESVIEEELDLNDLCIKHPEATYFVRVGSDSMIGDRIFPNDILVVDSSVEDVIGEIVVIWISKGFVLKRLRKSGEMIVLHSSNPDYLPIYVHKDESYNVLGVVRHVVFEPAKFPIL